jgi:hypothetical protein
MDWTRATPLAVTVKPGDREGCAMVTVEMEIGPPASHLQPMRLWMEVELQGADVPSMTMRELIEEVARKLLIELSDALALQRPGPPTPP